MMHRALGFKLRSDQLPVAGLVVRATALVGISIKITRDRPHSSRSRFAHLHRPRQLHSTNPSRSFISGSQRTFESSKNAHLNNIPSRVYQRSSHQLDTDL